jgi:hypothetical protein
MNEQTLSRFEFKEEFKEKLVELVCKYPIFPTAGIGLF